MAEDGMTIGKAYVQILPSTEGISGQLSSVLGDAGDSAGATSGKKFGSSFKSALGSTAKVAAGAVLTAGTAVAGLGKSFVDSASGVASYGDSIDKMSQKIGISAEAYQEWDAILQHSGSSMSAMKPAMKTLAAQAEKGSEAFQKLGISTEEAANMSREDLFAATITGLQNITDENERASLATELLGKSGMELGALLNTSAEDTEAMRKRVHELGGVMSDEAVKAAAAFQDSLQDMSTAMEGIKRNAMADFLPSLTGIMDGITNILAGDTDHGLQQISESVSQMIGKLNEKVPQIMTIAKGLIGAFGQAIITNLPSIIESGTQIVMDLFQGIVQALPEIANAGMEAILTLASGISDSLPELIPAMVEAVLTLVQGLLDNVDQLVDAALQLMMGLAQGLINALPVLIEKAPEIISSLIEALIGMIPQIAEAGVMLLTSLVQNLPQIIAKIIEAIPKIISSIVKAFAQGVPQLISAGMNLVKGIGQGIIKGAVDVINQARKVAGDIVSAIKDFFRISSPSKVMMEMGQYIDEGLAQGINSASGSPVRSMSDLSEDVSDAFAPRISIDAIQSGSYSTAASAAPVEMVRRNAKQPVPITVILELNRQELGRAVYQLNEEETQRVGVNLARGYGV